jgi:hypothetical protein
MRSGLLKLLRLIATIWLLVLGGVYIQANASSVFHYDGRRTSTAAYDGASSLSLVYDGASVLLESNRQGCSVAPFYRCRKAYSKWHSFMDSHSTDCRWRKLSLPTIPTK